MNDNDNNNENPYAPPPCSGKGWYDWSLAKKLFRIAAWTMAVLVIIDVGIFLKYRRAWHRSQEVHVVIMQFFTDWGSRVSK